MLQLLPLTLLLALEATANAISKSARPGHGFERRQLAPRDGNIKLHVAVRQNDGGAAVERQLLRASDPSSAGFRQHLSSDEAAQLSPPSQDSILAVEKWLREHGLLAKSSLCSGLFEVDATIHEAQKLLNTTYFVFSDGQQEVVRTELYHLPADVAGHVDFVTPTTHFPGSRPIRSDLRRKLLKRDSIDQSLDSRDSCGVNDNTTPTCVRQVYGINYTAQADRTTFAVFATEGATFDPKDIQTYLERFNPAAAQASPSYQVIGTGDPANEGGIEPQFETALDTQALLGVVWPAKGILYNLGGVFGPKLGQTYDNFLQFLTELQNNKTVPSVVSFSESTAEYQMDPDYARRLCNMFAQIGTRGVTLVFSSGNNGANGNQPTDPHNKMIFEPKFPASCPWVTAVGGTTNLADEQAATNTTIPTLNKVSFIASGGGFSNLFTAPEWQKSVVNSYIANNVPSTYHTGSGFNATGRGYPDVSAFSTNFPTVVGGLTIPIGGTSAAAPTWAAVIALLNDYEASQNRSSLGFVNPWLYSLKAGLKDITKGGNNVGECIVGNNTLGCGFKTLGYNVTEGWDPVTGLGSPMWPGLVAALDQTAAPSNGSSGGGQPSWGIKHSVSHWTWALPMVLVVLSQVR